MAAKRKAPAAGTSASITRQLLGAVARLTQASRRSLPRTVVTIYTTRCNAKFSVSRLLIYLCIYLFIYLFKFLICIFVLFLFNLFIFTFPSHAPTSAHTVFT
jgi:hypothetical protein